MCYLLAKIVGCGGQRGRPTSLIVVVSVVNVAANFALQANKLIAASVEVSCAVISVPPM